MQSDGLRAGNAAKGGHKPANQRRKNKMKRTIIIILALVILITMSADPAEAKKKHKQHKHKCKVVKVVEDACPYCKDGTHSDCPYWYIDGATGEGKHMTPEEIRDFEEMEMR